jgi:cell division GTPase FtsZ
MLIYNLNNSFIPKRECIALSSLVGLDYADIKQIFMMNSLIELKRYKTKLHEKDNIIKDIKKDFKKIDSSFFVVSGGTDINLSEIIDIAEKIGKISIIIVYGVRIEENFKGKIEVSLFAGWKK